MAVKARIEGPHLLPESAIRGRMNAAETKRFSEEWRSGMPPATAAVSVRFKVPGIESGGCVYFCGEG